MLLSLTLLRITFKLNSKHKTKNKSQKTKTQKHKNQNTEIKNPSLAKEQVENADLYKLVMNKTMTTCK